MLKIWNKNLNFKTKFCSEAALDEEEEEICSAGVGAVHQAVLDNNLEKLEKLIDVKTI